MLILLTAIPVLVAGIYYVYTCSKVLHEQDRTLGEYITHDLTRWH